MFYDKNIKNFERIKKKALFAPYRNTKLFSAFASSAVKYFLTTFSGHSRPKTMGAVSFYSTGLKGSFHVFLLFNIL